MSSRLEIDEKKLDVFKIYDKRKQRKPITNARKMKKIRAAPEKYKALLHQDRNWEENSYNQIFS
jgi:hypothetical protein